MAHYAFLDENNIVTEVIVGKNESNFNWEQQYGMFRGQVCKRTSCNTIGGVHQLGGKPFRKNHAGIGYTYDENRDAFIAPKPYASWILNETTCLWEAPVAYPDDDNSFSYSWNETNKSWDLIE